MCDLGFGTWNLEFVFEGGIAQLGERLPCTQVVSGSSPLTSTKQEGEK